MIPEKLGRYEVLGELGKGAMGVVYLARDPLIGRQLALKTFRLGYSAGDQELEQFRTRFLREAQSAGILSHPNIVTIHDVAVDPGGDFFIAMEYVQGTDLKLVMQRQGRFEPSFAAEIVAQIADGLGYAHAKGVVHRDIKPANIIITADKQAKITDFGIARVEASNLTMEGQLLGTPNYMAPEQIQGKEVDHRADVFSLGVVLYELVTGKKPFAAPNLSAVTHRIVFEPFPPLEEQVPGLPPGFARVLDRALAKDPVGRYDRGAEMAADLRAIYAPASSASATAALASGHSGSFLDLMPAPAPVPTPPPALASAAEASTATATLPPAGAVSAPGVTHPAGLSVAAFPPRATMPPAADGRRGLPLAARVAAAVGLALALALVGAGVFRLVASGAGAPRAEHPELQRQAISQTDGHNGAVAEAELASRLEAARQALRARDYPSAIRLAGEVLEADPEHPEGAQLLAEARAGESRREEIRDRLANPQPPPPSRPEAGQPTPSAHAVPPVAAPAGAATLIVELVSAISEGRLTIFTGQEKIYQQPFKFVAGGEGMFRRQKATSGSMRQRVTVAAGNLDLRIYVWRKDAQTRTAEVAGILPPSGTRTLKIEVSAEGRVKAALE